MSGTGCETFDRWCSLHGEQPLPAAPAAVARFVTDIAATGVEKIWPMVGTISRAHYLIGLADPTLGGAVTAAINEIAAIEPPTSWPDPLKLRFKTLPYDLQAFLAMQEKEQRRVVTRAQQEAAESRKALAAIQQPAKVPNGNQQNPAACPAA